MPNVGGIEMPPKNNRTSVEAKLEVPREVDQFRQVS